MLTITKTITLVADKTEKCEEGMYSRVATPTRYLNLIDLKCAEDVSNATANRMLSLLRAVLRRAVSHWDVLEKAPQFSLLREPSRRVRFLTRAEAARLIVELPEHLADMAVLSLSTGLRASNVTGLQWSQVNLDRVVTRLEKLAIMPHPFY